jgi:hypothetical protein
LIFFIGIFSPALVGAASITWFDFGNHIDTHQSSRLVIRNGEPVRLIGEFSIYFPGGIDEASGLPIDRHPSIGSPR